MKIAHDARHRRRVARVNPHDPRARVLGQHHRAVQHARHAHVVDERLLAERLLEAALPRRRIADPMPFDSARLSANARIAVQPELFAEEVVAPRLVREPPAVRDGLTAV